MSRKIREIVKNLSRCRRYSSGFRSSRAGVSPQIEIIVLVINSSTSWTDCHVLPVEIGGHGRSAVWTIRLVLLVGHLNLRKTSKSNELFDKLYCNISSRRSVSEPHLQTCPSLIRCEAAWQTIHRVTRLSSPSSPDRLRNCLWCTSRLVLAPHDWQRQPSRRSILMRSSWYALESNRTPRRFRKAAFFTTPARMRGVEKSGDPRPAGI
jgi:hypothetical protein